MLHPAGILLGGLWLYTCIHQQLGEKAVFFIGTLCYFASYISQANKALFIFFYKASAQKRCNGVSNARLTELHMARYIYRAYQPFLPLKDQYGL